MRAKLPVAPYASYTAPVGPLEVNWGDRYAESLISVMSPHTDALGAGGLPKCLVRNAQLLPTSTSFLAKIQSGSFGSLLSTPAGGEMYVPNTHWLPENAVGGFSPITVMVFGSVADASSSPVVYGFRANFTFEPRAIFYCTSTPRIAASFGLSTSVNIVSTQAYTVDDPFVGVLTIRSATDYELVIRNISPTNTSIQAYAAATSLGVASGTSTLPRERWSVHSNVYLSAAWSRSMTRAEMYALTENPWRVVRPVARNFVTSSSGLPAGVIGGLLRPRLITSSYWAA